MTDDAFRTLASALDLDLAPVALISPQREFVLRNRAFREQPHAEDIEAFLSSEAAGELLERGRKTNVPTPARLVLDNGEAVLKCLLGRLELPERGVVTLVRLRLDHEAGRFYQFREQVAQLEKETRRRVRVEREAKMLFDQASDALGLLDQQGRLMAVNPALCRLAKTAERELTGRMLPDVVDLGVMRSQLAKGDAFQAWLDRVQNLPFEAAVLNPKGEPTPVEVNLSKVNGRGPSAAVMVARDLSSSLRYEEARKRARVLQEARDQAEAREQALSGLLGYVSHEMRTPISAIIALAELLIADPKLNSEQRALVTQIDQSAERALERASNLLETLRAESGRSSAVETDFKPVHVVKDAVRQIMPIARKWNTTVSFVCSGDEETSVHGQPSLLYRIAQNLLSNAVKFAPGGTVLIHVSTEEMAGANLFRLVVNDTGQGIPEDKLNRIFEAFETGSRHGDISEGAGLGLAIVRRAVNQMGGAIEVSSDPGKGTTVSFTCVLDAAAASDAEKASEAAPEPVTDPAPTLDPPAFTVLVAEDEDVNREVLVKRLHRLGLSTLEARNGQEAVAQALQHQPDLVFIDINMPVMDGPTAVRGIREARGGAGLYIVGLTANLSKDVMKDCLESGMNEAREKPLRRAELADVLSTVMARV